MLYRTFIKAVRRSRLGLVLVLFICGGLLWVNLGSGTISLGKTLRERLSLFCPAHSSQADRERGSGRPAPHQHVYYLKTHKTGSTTMLCILAEYCRTHNLLPLLPAGDHFNLQPPFNESQISFVQDMRSGYDMIFNHHIFTPEILSYLHSDAFTVTTLREAYDNFKSNLFYFSGPPPEGQDKVMNLLQRGIEHSQKKMYQSTVNNRQSMDLGYDMSHSFMDEDYIRKFINETEKRFNLVLITEYFDEGLVILKRQLNWRTEDIVYLKKNMGIRRASLDKEDTPEVDALKRKLHAGFSKADIMLYEHFLSQFQARMAREIGLSQEVAEFKDILLQVKDYCRLFPHGKADLVVPQGIWSDSINISPQKCLFLGMHELAVTHSMKNQQHAMAQDPWWRYFIKQRLTFGK